MDPENNNDNLETGNDSLATPEAEGSGLNPAWSPLLDVLPEQFRVMPSVTDQLKQWDSNYNELQEKYKPYADLPEVFRDPETLQSAMNLWQNTMHDPHQTARALAEHLGLTLSEAQQLQEEIEEQEETPLEFNEEDDPRLAELYKQLEAEKARNSQFYEQYTAQEQAKIQQAEEHRMGQEIDGKVRQLIEGGHIPRDAQGNPDQVLLKDLMTRANFLISQGSRDPIMDAYKAQQEIINYASARQAPPKQPLLFMPPSGGAAPANDPKPPDLSTSEGRIALARKYAEAANNHG